LVRHNNVCPHSAEIAQDVREDGGVVCVRTVAEVLRGTIVLCRW
jgi:hypothetical protein